MLWTAGVCSGAGAGESSVGYGTVAQRGQMINPATQPPDSHDFAFRFCCGITFVFGGRE